MGKYLVLLLLCTSIACISGYRLNVPRVLLPYHPTNRVNYTLEVSHPEGGCFNWRSTRPDVVSVEPINPSPRGCSDKAMITSKSKHAEEQSAVIFAEEPATGVTLSCGVTVDVMESIEITTTTKVLFVDAAPARMIVEAFNKEGDRFSNLGDIPFDWHFTFEEGRSLRIVPFGQSKYDAPPGIEELERDKKKGFVVLVEGIHTGDAKLTARFSEPEFSHITGNAIELLVIANVLLVPSHDLYVPQHSTVQYGAVIGYIGILAITLPSTDYSLKLSNTSVCTLDQRSSKVYAQALGTTDITLIDMNMKSHKHGLKPQSARISVVEPDAIQFSIDHGGLWYLQKDLDYRIHVRLTDVLGNFMFIPDNAKFDTKLPLEYFDVLESSNNGTYFHVKAKKSGKAVLKSTFTSILDNRGYEVKIKTQVDGEQELTISDPIKVDPALLVFPLAKDRYQYQLRASGGTGLYQWSSSDRSIAMVEESKGMVHSGDLGETVVEVHDVYNPAHTAQAKVLVIEPSQVHFGISPVEAEVGSDLVVNIQLMGKDSKGNNVPFTDCRQIPIKVTLDDYSIFSINSAASKELPSEKRGCTTVTLKALKSGDTKIKVWFNSQSAVLDISAFPSLKLTATPDLLMMLGSAKTIAFEGGPRPWLLDSSGYFASVKSNVEKQLSVNLHGNNFHAYCSEHSGEATITVAVGNRKSATNSLPAVARSKIHICCAVPTRLALTTKPKSSQNLPSCPAFAHSIHFNIATNVQLTGYGKCASEKDAEEREFDSISSLNVDFSTKQNKLLAVEPLPVDASEPNKIPSKAVPKGLPGTVDIEGRSKEFYALGSENPKKSHKIPSGELVTRLSLNLVDFAKADPPNIVLWDEKNVRGKVIVSGGSGHFWFDNDEIRQFVQATLHSHPKDNIAHIELTPVAQGLTKLSLYDLCIDGSRLDIGVKVTDINRIVVKSADMIELGTNVPMKIEVLDIEGVKFPSEDVKLMNLQVTSSSEFIKLQKSDLLNYDVRGLKVGTSTITATARSSSGKVIRSSPHQIQVFEPLRLDPREVTLIPESVFQLQILGGPQSLPSLRFSLNNSAVASVSDNGLITSTTTLGYSSITAAVTNRDVPITRDSVVLKVVSMTAIKIVVSTTTVQEGEIVSARIQGVADDETPFSFGGALYPLSLSWKLSSDDILHSIPLSDAVNEVDLNKFSISYLAKRSGRVTLQANVVVHEKAKKHFQGKNTKFSDSIQITIEPSLRLINPQISSAPIIMTVDSLLDLSANRPRENVDYSTMDKTPLLWLSGENKDILTTGSHEGFSALKMTYTSSSYNESTIVPVEILPVHSIHMMVDLPPPTTSPSTLEFLPLGTWIRLTVQFRDARGRPFHATNTKLGYRPNRFDLTEILPTDGNRTFSVHLKQPGETVFKVWDSADPKKMAFIRLPVAAPPPPPEEINVTEECAAPVSQNLFLAKNQDKKAADYVDHKKDDTKAQLLNSLANFMDRNLSVILVLLIVGLCSTLIFAGYRLGSLTERQAKQVPVWSPIPAAGRMDDSYGQWRSSPQPILTSTPRDPYITSPRKSPKKAFIEEQSSYNPTRLSTGSAGDPFLWSTDNLKSSPSVVNRFYRD